MQFVNESKLMKEEVELYEEMKNEKQNKTKPKAMMSLKTPTFYACSVAKGRKQTICYALSSFTHVQLFSPHNKKTNRSTWGRFLDSHSPP